MKQISLADYSNNPNILKGFTNAEEIVEKGICDYLDNYIEKGGKPAVIGERRTWSGREFVKTAKGWSLTEKGKEKQHVVTEEFKNMLDKHSQANGMKGAYDALSHHINEVLLGADREDDATDGNAIHALDQIVEHSKKEGRGFSEAHVLARLKERVGKKLLMSKEDEPKVKAYISEIFKKRGALKKQGTGDYEKRLLRAHINDEE